jgi:hypothetical protein
MNIPRCVGLALPLLSLSLIATSADASAATGGTAQTYDQIVRVSLAEGDVRVSRGKEGEHATGSAWGVAATNLPIESGFSLVTGTGRAEIEFEDASTVYLGDNSVLTFNELTATGGVPHSELTLVSGTATLHVQPTFPGENFVLTTPTSRVSVFYGGKAFMRVSSYLDAVMFSPQEGSTIYMANAAAGKRVPGETITYYADHKLAPEVSSGAGAFAEWDEWTAKRLATRAAVMAAMMKDSGLASPIPGLAEMKGQGTFFDCAPYGTCWEPAGGWERQEAGQVESSSLRQSTTSPRLLLASMTLQSASPDANLRTEYDDSLFPCMPGQVRRLISRDPVTGRETVLRTDIDLMGVPPYSWAVCHTGDWIHRGHRYVWVAGTHRHHHCPVHWVKYGRTAAFVPTHPHDVAGKAPINLKYGVFEASGKKGESVERVAFDPGTQVKVLSAAPKEFRAEYFAPLKSAEMPRVEAHLVKAGAAPGRNADAKPSGIAITFDHKSQSFLVARQMTVGTKSTMVAERFGGLAGDGQVRTGRGSWSGGTASRSGGGSSGSYGHSSSMAGGGSRSSGSGGSSGGGGGSHGSSGGGGGSSSGGGGGASSGGSSGGGSHR